MVQFWMQGEGKSEPLGGVVTLPLDSGGSGVDGLAILGIDVDGVGGAGLGCVQDCFVGFRRGIDQVGDMLFVKLEGLWCYVDTVARAYAARLVYGYYVRHLVWRVLYRGEMRSS